MLLLVVLFALEVFSVPRVGLTTLYRRRRRFLVARNLPVPWQESLASARIVSGCFVLFWHAVTYVA
jgi:hypothetical protein